jgi:hypothetical protein
MDNVLSILLPPQADNYSRGMKLPVYVFALIAIASTIRSLIHLLAPDGGAGSIAGLDLSVEGASGIIFSFALWGSAQLVYALIQLVVVFRYRSLVPLMYSLLILEVLLRELVGLMKPVRFEHTPPGAFANYVILPLAVVMLGLAVWSAKKDTRATRKKRAVAH